MLLDITHADKRHVIDPATHTVFQSADWLVRSGQFDVFLRCVPHLRPYDSEYAHSHMDVEYGRRRRRVLESTPKVTSTKSATRTGVRARFPGFPPPEFSPRGSRAGILAASSLYVLKLSSALEDICVNDDLVHFTPS